MSFWDLFIGSTQSKYASFAIITAIVVICLAVLFTNTEISFGNRLVSVIFIILLSIFPIALSLFELTCIVNSDTKNSYQVCGYYAWVIAVMIIVYSLIIIIATFLSMFTYKKALDNVKVEETFNTAIDEKDAEQIAKNMMGSEVDVSNQLPTQQANSLQPEEVQPKQSEQQVQPEQNVGVQTTQSEISGYSPDNDQYATI